MNTPTIRNRTRPRITVGAWLLLMIGLIAGLLAFRPLPAAAAEIEPIPLTETAPTVDGLCNPDLEYSSALQFNYVDAFDVQGTVYVTQTESDLYVCARGAVGDNRARYFALYLDRNNGREQYAGKEDVGLLVAVLDNANRAVVGTGEGGYDPDESIVGWEAKTTSVNSEQAEWRVPLSLIGECGAPFGMAVFHHDVTQTGDDYGWPDVKTYDSPATWQEMGPNSQICQADLRISKSDSVDPIRVGEQFEYILVVENLGPADAHNIKVTDTLPDGVQYVGYDAPAGVTCAEANGVVTCTIPTLGISPAGGPGSITIRLKVRAASIGQWTNQATVTAQRPPDPVLANNEDSEETEIVGLSGKIAYVFRSNTATAGNFKSLLEGKGFTVQLIRCPAVMPTDFKPFDLILIADDTGSLSNWCAGNAGAAHIDAAGKPVIGLGEGGYAYFGRLGMGIGWPNGWHGPLDTVRPIAAASPYFHVPTDFGAPLPALMTLYTAPVNTVSIYLPSAPAASPFALEPADDRHAPLIEEGCDQLWGFSGGPVVMNGDGRDLLVNAVVYGLGRRCAPPPPVNECITLEKIAVPPHGTPVKVGDVISYRLVYKVANTPACAAQQAVLQDPIPIDTLFVPGSASDGIVPGVDKVLRWHLGNLAPGASGEKRFQVYVTDAQCNNQRRVNNQARLVSSLGIVVSNLVSHPVDCPPVVPQGTQPPYAEDEIQIYPYPIVAGRATEFSVRIRNLISVTQQVSVTFETSPNNFGIGIPFAAVPIPDNPRLVTLPPFGVVEVKWTWTPPVSGHFCVRIRIESPGHAPIFTYRNLDVMENLQPGVEDTLPFAVGNPTATTANILLVVDNTCPGWQAWVNPVEPAEPLVLANMAPGEVRTATLHVIPPTDRPLGTACHIDVQGWIGGTLIGGIRKLDVPPVHLPPANPPWMEKEISVIPDPLVVGQPGQICVELQNPLPFPRTVDVDYAVADFGAGIPFTPVGTRTITLPPNSIDKYCIAWTPTASNNLHRCIQIRLRQPNFQDQLSQRNIDLVRRPRLTISEILATQIPIQIGNTRPFSRELEIRTQLVGIPPLVRPRILPDPPPFLAGNAQMEFTLTFEAIGARSTAEDEFAEMGDAARLEVGVYLDDELEGGFTVEFAKPEMLYLPQVTR